MSHCSGSLCIIEGSLPYNKHSSLRQLLLCYINQTELSFYHWTFVQYWPVVAFLPEGTQCGQFPCAWYGNLFFFVFVFVFLYFLFVNALY